MLHVAIIITGVSGSGKTTIGKMLARQTGLRFFDADHFHSEDNIQKMRIGTALNDEDRKPWLQALRAMIHSKLSHENIILACSALKQEYRNFLEEGLEGTNFCWIHLQGDFETIARRLAQREGHFMSPDLLRSQFDLYEVPKTGLFISVKKEPGNIIKQIISYLYAQYPNIMVNINPDSNSNAGSHLPKLSYLSEEKNISQVGLAGLGVMGISLARNIAGKGFTLSLYNRRVSDKEEEVARKAVEKHTELSDALPFEDLKAFAASLQKPRKIILMVNAGKPVDEVIEKLIPELDAGDVIIDGGNSFYKDTVVRMTLLHSHGIHFIGSGISGGEEGALNGPSVMPGGSKAGFEITKEILYALAARNEKKEICCAYIGDGGAGHFVKMVHNGIEYAEMQIIAEVYSHLRFDLGITVNEIAQRFKSWQNYEADSYLLGITCDILNFYDADGELLLDKIQDAAGNKGTGSWTTITACELGVAVPLISAALFARYLSSYKAERLKYQTIYQPSSQPLSTNEEAIYALFMFARILNHYQGLQLIQEASKLYQWNIDLNALLRTWSGGCIIRSKLLEIFRDGLKGGTSDILKMPFVTQFIDKHLDEIKKLTGTLALSQLPYPVLSASLDYFKYLTNAESNANLIQAQRDYFGAHRYQIKNDVSGQTHHTQWQ